MTMKTMQVWLLSMMPVCRPTAVDSHRVAARRYRNAKRNGGTMPACSVSLSLVAASAMLVWCATSTPSAAGEAQTPVASVRLADKEMTPVEMVLTRDIPAGTELQLCADDRFPATSLRRPSARLGHKLPMH